MSPGIVAPYMWCKTRRAILFLEGNSKRSLYNHEFSLRDNKQTWAGAIRLHDGLDRSCTIPHTSSEAICFFKSFSSPVYKSVSRPKQYAAFPAGEVPSQAVSHSLKSTLSLPLCSSAFHRRYFEYSKPIQPLGPTLFVTSRCPSRQIDCHKSQTRNPRSEAHAKPPGNGESIQAT